MHEATQWLLSHAKVKNNFVIAKERLIGSFWYKLFYNIIDDFAEWTCRGHAFDKSNLDCNNKHHPVGYQSEQSTDNTITLLFVHCDDSLWQKQRV